MSKFEPLTRALRKLPPGERRYTFAEIEAILGFPLPPSARRHRPWWSNNAQNSAMTRAWLKAGCRSARVDMDQGSLVFEKAASLAPTASARLHGALAGTVRINAAADAMLPTGERWAADEGRV